MIFYFSHSLIGNALDIASGVLIAGKYHFIATISKGSEVISPDLVDSN